ncbi:unnamed protein product [Paramecium octaurelia]|uniref:Transmembrane protein n=1 Tax=Paramecium octaurelia TaxID=43137 RepID=A0A8S1YK08_PAROT|nr:unnamed protein product [Paramecium octaurelia]
MHLPIKFQKPSLLSRSLQQQEFQQQHLLVHIIFTNSQVRQMIISKKQEYQTFFRFGFRNICCSYKRNSWYSNERKKILFSIFQFWQFVLGSKFLILGLITMALDNTIEKDHTCNPSDPQYTAVQKLYFEVDTVLCKDSCECYYYKDITYQVAREVKVYSKTDQTKAINAQECDYFYDSFPLDVEVIQWMENKFDCSGWCISYSNQIFDDVNSDVKNYNHAMQQQVIILKQYFIFLKQYFCNFINYGSYVCPYLLLRLSSRVSTLIQELQKDSRLKIMKDCVIYKHFLQIILIGKMIINLKKWLYTFHQYHNNTKVFFILLTIIYKLRTLLFQILYALY